MISPARDGQHTGAVAFRYEPETACFHRVARQRYPTHDAEGTVDRPERKVLMPRERPLTPLFSEQEVLEQHRLRAHQPRGQVARPVNQVRSAQTHAGIEVRCRHGGASVRREVRLRRAKARPQRTRMHG